MPRSRTKLLGGLHARIPVSESWLRALRHHKPSPRRRLSPVGDGGEFHPIEVSHGGHVRLPGPATFGICPMMPTLNALTLSALAELTPTWPVVPGDRSSASSHDSSEAGLIHDASKDGPLLHPPLRQGFAQIRCTRRTSGRGKTVHGQSSIATIVPAQRRGRKPGGAECPAGTGADAAPRQDRRDRRHGLDLHRRGREKAACWQPPWPWRISAAGCWAARSPWCRRTRPSVRFARSGCKPVAL